MAEMKQFMVLITELERARLDALRIVTGVSRSEVNRQLLTHALPYAEREHAQRLARLSAVAGAAGYPDVAGFISALVADPRYRQKTPTLEELEAQYIRPEQGTGSGPLAESLSEA